MTDLEHEDEAGGGMGDVGGFDDPEEEEIPGVGSGDETAEDEETLSDDEL